MVGVSAGGAAGVLTSVLIAGRGAWRGEDPPTVKLETHTSFLSPDWDPARPDCKFYNASYKYKDGLCSHFSISRMGVGVQQEALKRALDCATAHETDCILSPEVGLSVPAAFVYDEVSGLKMLIAPKFLDLTSELEADPRAMELAMPDGKRTGVQLTLNSSVNVEFLEGATREIKQSILSGSSAHCAQLLRFAFVDECWASMD